MIINSAAIKFELRMTIFKYCLNLCLRDITGKNLRFSYSEEACKNFCFQAEEDFINQVTPILNGVVEKLLSGGYK